MVVVAAFALGLVGFVLRQEYSDWAGRLALWMIFQSARFHPNGERMRKEWTAELRHLQRSDIDARGLVYAGSLFVRYVLTAPMRIVDPTDVPNVILLPLLWSVPWLIPFNLLTVTMLGFFFERRRLRKLPGGQSLQSEVVISVRTRTEWYVSVTLRWVSMAALMALAARRGTPMAYLGAALVVGWVLALRFSIEFQSWVADWRRRRYELIDPR